MEMQRRQSPPPPKKIKDGVKLGQVRIYHTPGLDPFFPFFLIVFLPTLPQHENTFL